MDPNKALKTAEAVWEGSIVPTLKDYICIPNRSPSFDENWKANGHMDRAADMFLTWAQQQPVPGLEARKLELDGRTPILLMEIPATSKAAGTVLLYGHYDKQPECGEWSEGLSPWDPVRDGDRLYGRGAADDGYAMFASLTALRILAEQDVPHGRIVVLIEGSEESGSPDLPAYVEAYSDVIGTPELVICLDSGNGNYDQLWMTTSLRGIAVGDLSVEILTAGVHSGSASGIVPDSFHIARTLLDRFVDEGGTITNPNLWVEIPSDRLLQAEQTAVVLGDAVFRDFPWVSNALPKDSSEIVKLLMRGTWAPTLTVIGVAGFPPTLEGAGNVLRASTTLRLSMRVPPTADAAEAAEKVKRILETDPPYGAHVHFEAGHMANGWNAPSLAPWLEKSVNNASLATFGKPAVAWGEGGTIPFMGMLGEQFPEAQFLITGLLGPESNAHGPDEFLHIPMAKKLTAAVALVIADHANKD